MIQYKHEASIMSAYCGYTCLEYGTTISNDFVNRFMNLLLFKSEVFNMGYFDIGTYKRSRKTLEDQARRAVIAATGNENPIIKFPIGTFNRSRKTLEDQVKYMIALNTLPDPPEPTPTEP